MVGDTIRSGTIKGRVEHITLRRTVVRDDQGALWTISNSDLGSVANLSRDWGQVFVDVTVPAGTSIDAALNEMIDAGNTIATLPYIWGGGHGSWISPGYDCSGSVSYVLHAAGLLSVCTRGWSSVPEMT